MRALAGCPNRVTLRRHITSRDGGSRLQRMNQDALAGCRHTYTVRRGTHCVRYAFPIAVPPIIGLRIVGRLPVPRSPIELNLDLLGGVSCLLNGFGDNHRQDLTDMPNVIGCHRGAADRQLTRHLTK